MRLLQQLLWIAALSFIGVHAELLESCTECQNNITYSGSCNKLTGADATCVCADGYQEDDNDFTKCVDIDECAGSAHGCKSGAAEDCKNSVAAHECINCPTGQVLNNLKQCVEDMCSGSSHECKSGAAEDCDSNQGTYKCINCPIDHVLNQDYRCVDDSVCHGVCVASAYFTGVCRDINGKPYCICQPGFAVNPNFTRQCRDIDECAGSAHGCKSGAAEDCKNSVGAYECINCPTGQVLNDLKQCVVHQDPCTGACPASASHTGDCALGGADAPGLPKTAICKCQKGFRNTSISTLECEDVDECSGSLHTCKSGAAEHCTNTPGSYTCIECALQGFEPKSGVCTEINECEKGTHNCQSESHCTNTVGSFECTACNGTQVVGSNKKCVDAAQDIDECAGSAHGCKSGAAEDCKNSEGAYECINCPTGQVLNNLKQCVAEGPCKDACVASDSLSGKCSVSSKMDANCECNPGYEHDSNNLTCKNVNECADGVHGCKTGGADDCVDSAGGYACLHCADGYQLNAANKRCEDVDECRADTHTCRTGLAADCLNLPGKYECYFCKDDEVLNESNHCTSAGACKVDGASICVEDAAKTGHCSLMNAAAVCKCKPGYVNSTTDPTTCEDLNECLKSETHDCLDEASCANGPGSYTCTKCKAGFVMDDNRRCTAEGVCKDACSQSESLTGRCTVNNGKAECECNKGYAHNLLDKTQCRDINECQADGHGCKNNLSCTNLLGTYMCTKCADGQVVGSTDRCVAEGACKDHICPRANLNSTDGTCRLDKDSKPYCYCYAGYKNSTTDKNDCVDINECSGTDVVVNNCLDESSCKNTPGSHICTKCKEGYVFNTSHGCDAEGLCKDACKADASKTGVCKLDEASKPVCECRVLFSNEVLDSTKCVRSNLTTPRPPLFTTSGAHNNYGLWVAAIAMVVYSLV